MLVSGLLNDTQRSRMIEAECQKTIIIPLIYQGIFVPFRNTFRRLFHLVFAKNIHENIKEIYISGHK